MRQAVSAMLYKEYLSKMGQLLNQAGRDVSGTQKGKEKKPNPKTVNCDSEEDEEDDSVLIKWELEWRHKPGAVAIN